MQKAIVTLLLFSCLQGNAQNIGIGTNAPAASAILDVSSTNKGLLMPRMTTAQRNAIASPAVGLQIFNLEDQCTDIYDGANWIKNCGLKVISTTTDPGHPTPNSWTQKASFGGAIRYGGVGFSIGSKGYIGTGAAGNSGNSNDFWEYNPTTNAWAQKANVGGKERVSAVGFSIGSKGYIGTGAFVGQSQNDFWEYDPFTNVWTQKAPFGGEARFDAVGFSIGSKGYIGTGYNGFNQYDFWEYDPSTNAWTEKAKNLNLPRFGAVGFSIGSKGYIGIGYDGSNYKNDFWEYDPATNAWVKKAPFGGTARFYAVGFSIGNKGYIGTGTGGGSKNDFWEYDPATNSWIQKADFGGTARKGAVGFSIGNKGFLGTGTTNISTNDFWEYLDDNVNRTYSANTISSENNTVTDGAWTLANGTVYNANSGNVGIGTTAPSHKLHIISNVASALRIDALKAGTDAISIGGLGKFVIDAPNIFGGRFIVNEDGKVGIGTAAPTALLDVAGTLNANAWKTQSATPNGYANMGGVLTQWGTVNYTNSTSQTINFPVGFTEVFSVTLTIDNNGTTNSPGSNVPPKLVAVGITNFQMGGMQTFNNDNTCKVRWMAVGR